MYVISAEAKPAPSPSPSVEDSEMVATLTSYVTQVDLGDPSEQKLALKYPHGHEVLVLVMGPSCRSLGPTSNLNYNVNVRTTRGRSTTIKTCLMSVSAAQPYIHQRKKQRHFVVEQPRPTWLVHGPPWPQVCQHPGVCSMHIDQCRVGQKGPNGFPA